MFYKLSAAVRRNRKWFVMLACVIVFVTTYALILPAITIDKDTAIEEPGLEVVLQDDETAVASEDGEELAEQTEPEPTEDVTEAEEMPAVTLEETVGGVSVKVEAEEGVFPADTTMVLNEVDDKKSLDSIEDAVDDAVKDVQAVEVAFQNADGDTVEPQDSYTMTVVPVTPADSEETQQVVVSLNESGEAAVVEPAQKDEAAQMVVAPDDVPVVALVETEVLTTTLLSASGKTYEVTVTFDNTAGIPEGARLSLKEFKESSRNYKEAKQAVLDAGVIPEVSPNGAAAPAVTFDTGSEDSFLPPMLIGGTLSAPKTNDEADEVTVQMDALDLTILDKDGNEIEPAAPVQVEITMKALPKGIEEEEFVSSVKVTHLRETGEGIRAEVVAENGSGTPGKVIVEENAAVISFETDSFSYYTVTWTYRSNNTTYYRSSNIHYGYMSGGRFVEFPNGTPGNTTININSSHSPAFLIYDVAGYQFDSAHLDSATGTEIEPLIRYNNSRWQYTTPPTNGNYSSSVSWTNIANSNNTNANQDIYMVYKAMDPVTNGGHAKLYETATDDPNDPTVLKESQNNHDGTRTLSLSVTGDTRPIEAEKLADVIVIYDVSGSMENDLNGNTTSDSSETRLAKGKQAIMGLANDLLNRKNREGGKLVRMALVTFSNAAQAIQMGSSGSYFTSDPSTYENAVDSVTPGGGTNWEMALQIANRLDVDPERETFVIFVTDGNPTWRMTRSPTDEASTDEELLKTSTTERDMFNSQTYQYYRQYNVFGQGSSDNKGKNYAAALAESASIVEHGKHYYSIGISNDVTNLDSLMEECGAGADHSFVTETEQDLWDAIEKIRLSIEGTLGWGDVEVVDGITNLTNLIAKAPIANVDPNSFTYQKSTDGGQTWTELNLQTEGINPATYDIGSGHVEWNMGESFQLAKDTTYKVSFLVWPAQLATDIVTDLNNGTKSYESLDPEIKAQIEDQGGYYTLKTNTDEAYVNYKVSRVTGSGVTTGDEVFTLPFQTVPPLVVSSMPFSINKVFTDELTEGEDRQTEVRLILERRDVGAGEDDWETVHISYINPQGQMVTDAETIILSAGNNWKADFFISPGLVDGGGQTLNEGHEYRLREADLDYHYELNSEIVHPYYRGYLTQAEAEAATEGELATELLGEQVYVRKIYDGDENHDKHVTAENIVKGGIDLRKYVVDAAGSNDLSPDEEFIIHGYILDKDGNGYTFNTDWDDRTDISTGSGANQTWIEHQNDPIAFHIYDKNDNRVGYKMHVADTADFTVKLKSGERIRFINVPQNSTYAFWEEDTDMPAGYSFVSVEGYNLTRDASGNYIDYDPAPLPDISPDGRVISGTVYGNVQHNVVVKNHHAEPNRIVVAKTVVKPDGETPTYPEKPFTIRGYVTDRFGDPYTVEDGNALTYNIVDKDGNYVVEGEQFPTSNTFTVTLRGGDRLEIPDVPALSSYLIWEETDALDDPDSNYAFVSISGTATSTTGSTPTQPHNQTTLGEDCVGGTMHEGEEHGIAVKNKMLHEFVDLQLEKVDAADRTMKLNGASFRLYTDELHETPAVDYLGNEIGEFTTGGFADDEETVPLGIAYVGQLLPGTYYLVETGTPPGYSALDDHVIVTVSDNGVTVLQAENAAAENVYTDDNTVTIVVTNTTGTELPHTGGPGTFLFTSGGLFMMAAAMIYLICVRRRERRIE